MDLETLLLVILLILVVGFTALFWLLRRQARSKDEQPALMLLQNQMNEITRTLDAKLGESTRAIQRQFSESTKIVRDVTERLTRLDETSKQVVEFADQLQNLQDILKNPKQRGVLGEYFLETLLKNAFQPKQYQMQYEFKNGEKVDAVLFFGDKIIPIDSKFSLENYNRIVEERNPAEKDRLEKLFIQDLKNRIDETAKYIRPQEGTMEFAFMFIPAEGIYYDLLVNQIGTLKANTRDLVDYATNEKKVHIVSPTTFYVTLQALAQGMKAYQIQESTKDIIKNVVVLGRHLGAYDDYFKKLGANLSITTKTYNRAYKELKKIDKDVLKVTGKDIGIEPQLLEQPEIVEEE